ncbi:hypothetical protein OV208_40505 [Corallococcus sp. bb12-1]|uniref:hypothetical protein n=1 Tax=Corallococcus sp. bb12-1 TaxID=2996784 RepID=UPI0022709F45|nr:hypothetical protein [Corallococcus sp. bb12-1]MCY1047650.1 hypothetical protein [Corallococcus sp. bb12-1]
MIIFVPAYDDATSANLAVAQDLQVTKSIACLNTHTGNATPVIPPQDHCLLANNAIRSALVTALNKYPDPLFAMSHGKPDYLSAQHGKIALNKSDTAALGNRTVFAFACHTSASLGRDLAQSGITWWGYIKEITAPDQQFPIRPLFVKIFCYIYDSFSTATSSSARLAIIQNIKQLCDSAETEIDELAAADKSLDVLEAHQSLRDIWLVLRVWAPQAESAEQHASAPDILPRWWF